MSDKDLTREPSTPRAQKTVALIFQAFTELYAKTDIDEITTNLIAKRAGLSVGTLYQYFANRDAIAIALIEETVSEAAGVTRDAILREMSESISETLPRALALLLKAYRDHQLILIDLANSTPKIRNAVKHICVEDLINRSSRIYIEEHADEIQPSDLELFRYMLYATVKGSIREYISNPPVGITDAAFVAELARVTSVYSLTEGG